MDINNFIDKLEEKSNILFETIDERMLSLKLKLDDMKSRIRNVDACLDQITMNQSNNKPIVFTSPSSYPIDESMILYYKPIDWDGRCMDQLFNNYQSSELSKIKSVSSLLVYGSYQSRFASEAEQQILTSRSTSSNQIQDYMDHHHHHARSSMRSNKGQSRSSEKPHENNNFINKNKEDPHLVPSSILNQGQELDLEADFEELNFDELEREHELDYVEDNEDHQDDDQVTSKVPDSLPFFEAEPRQQLETGVSRTNRQENHIKISCEPKSPHSRFEPESSTSIESQPKSYQPPPPPPPPPPGSLTFKVSSHGHQEKGKQVNPSNVVSQEEPPDRDTTLKNPRDKLMAQIRSGRPKLRHSTSAVVSKQPVQQESRRVQLMKHDNDASPERGLDSRDSLLASIREAAGKPIQTSRNKGALGERSSMRDVDGENPPSGSSVDHSNQAQKSLNSDLMSILMRRVSERRDNISESSMDSQSLHDGDKDSFDIEEES